jgi:hypothetical protein
MRFVGMAAACGLAFLPVAAHADVNGVVTGAQANLQFDPYLSGLGVNGALSFQGGNEAGLAYDKELSTGAYVVTTETKPNYIVFSNGATASGGLASVTTTTTIAITFTNTGDEAVRPKLVSTIDPAGLGLYIANISGCDQSKIASCPQVNPGAASFNTIQMIPNGGLSPLGGASVSMTISDSFSTLKSISAAMELDQSAKGAFIKTNFSGSALDLNSFGLSAASDGLTLMGYSWNMTDIAVDFPNTLAPGASDTLTYTTTVTSYVSAICSPNCGLVAYAGFGDPIGKGGGGGNIRHDTVLDGDTTLGADGVGYDAFGFALPVFENGKLDLSPVSLPAGVVPEPATWGLILAGFGCVGLALRRRSARQVA